MSHQILAHLAATAIEALLGPKDILDAAGAAAPGARDCLAFAGNPSGIIDILEGPREGLESIPALEFAADWLIGPRVVRRLMMNLLETNSEAQINVGNNHLWEEFLV